MRSNKFTKEAVYRRLLKNAGELWNVHQSDLESIDPLAKMMLGATAKELERIGNELYSSDSRIFHRLANFLLPDELQVASPAHAIVRLEPSEEGEITAYDEMYFEKKWKDKQNLNRINTADIAFSSAGEHPMSQLKLTYRVQGGHISMLNGIKMEELGNVSIHQNDNEILLGLRGAKNLNGSDVRLYFDWAVVEDKKKLFRSIPKITVVDLNNERLPLEHGIIEEQSTFDLRASMHPVSKLEQQVLNYYSERFIRLKWAPSEPTPHDRTLLNDLEELGDDADAEDLKWLKVIMPPDYDLEEIRDVIILDNCVPTLNRKLEKVIFRLLRDLNIRRIDFQNFFLGVERAESNKGDMYKDCPSFELNDMQPGSFNIRLGGAGRLDERDGHEYLNYLLDLLKDEKRSFSALDVTSTVSDLNSMEQILQRVKKRLDTAPGGKQPYIIIKPHTSSENAHMHFWTTDGTMANKIQPNSRLRVKNSGLARSGYATMVTASIAGSDSKDNKEMIQSFRTALLSRGMVVTKRDIAELCHSIGGTAVRSVEVHNGFMTSPLRTNGLQRTLDVVVSLSVQLQAKEQKEHLRQRMESELRSASNFSKPLRVIIA